MDIDFQTDLTGSFTISIGDSPVAVEGNRALVNRFEITLLTKTRTYLMSDDSLVTDNFGGDADKFINKPHVLNDMQGIAASVETAVEQTVKSILADQGTNVPNTEKLDRAELVSIDLNGEVVYAVVRVYPVETEAYADLVLNLPVTKRS
jgi:hypothetical protein